MSILFSTQDGVRDQTYVEEMGDILSKLLTINNFDGISNCTTKLNTTGNSKLHAQRKYALLQREDVCVTHRVHDFCLGMACTVERESE
jgi:hypothetical protein